MPDYHYELLKRAMGHLKSIAVCPKYKASAGDIEADARYAEISALALAKGGKRAKKRRR